MSDLIWLTALAALYLGMQGLMSVYATLSRKEA